MDVTQIDDQIRRLAGQVQAASDPIDRGLAWSRIDKLLEQRLRLTRRNSRSAHRRTASTR
jgi:hypothetical protein